MTLPTLVCCAQCGEVLRLKRLRPTDNGQPIPPLSTREMQVFTLIARGMQPADIAEELQIDVKTVSTYRSRLLTKLGVVNNRDLIVLAMRVGIK